MSTKASDLIEILDMSLIDLDCVYELEFNTYDFPWTRNIIKDCIINKYDCYIAKNYTVIGYAISKITSIDSHILNLTVDKKYRNMGIASSFIEMIISKAKMYNSNSIFLETRISNLAAKKLYEKYGFKSIDIRKNYYKTFDGREDAIIYRKILI
jgi:ribosomal-protein-alanine N-acetyltransferase